MNIGKLFPNPVDAVKGPITAFTDKREGQPYVQGVARNLGHAAFGDTIGNYVDQNYLGDPVPGQTAPLSAMGQSVQPTTQMERVQQNPILEQLMQMLSKTK